MHKYKNPSKCTPTKGVFIIDNLYFNKVDFLNVTFLSLVLSVLRTQQRKTDAQRSMDFMPLMIIHLHGPFYRSGSDLNTLQKLTHLSVTTSLWY